MIVICWDSLRLDAIEPLKGILGKETWTSFPSIDGFTGPILPSIITGKSPEELGVPRTDEAFYKPLDPSRYEDTLFDHFNSYITISRLIGPETQCCPLPPSRRNNMKFLHPIKWNAVSNWDVDIWRYLGRKWSSATNDWWDMIFFWSFITHGHYSIYDSMGAVESPYEIRDSSRIVQRLAEQNPQELRNLYMKGVYYAAETLRGLNEVCGGKELIICFSDHNESLGEEFNGRSVVGHFHGMHTIPGLENVPCWINRPDVEFPEDMSQLKLKDFIVDMYEKYEKNDEDYQSYKQKITQGKQIEKSEVENDNLSQEDEKKIQERLIKLGYMDKVD
jgi:hypothetical protein